MIEISLVSLGILFLADRTTLRELEFLSKDWQIDWQSVGRRERFFDSYESLYFIIDSRFIG